MEKSFFIYRRSFCSLLLLLVVACFVLCEIIAVKGMAKKQVL